MKILSQHVLFNRQSDNNQNKSVMTSPLKLNTLKADTVSFTSSVLKAGEIAEVGIATAKKVGAAINLNVKGLDDLPLDLTGVNVLVRVDHNVPIKKGVITSDNRIKESLETIEELLNRNALITIMTHIGDPFKLKKGEMGSKTSTKIVADKLQELLRQKQGFEHVEVIHSKNVIGNTVLKQSKELKQGQILYLENLRFVPAETGKGAKLNLENGLYEKTKISEHKQDKFGEILAKFGSVLVDDAFGVSHRPNVSNTMVPLEKIAGSLMEKEIKNISPLFTPQEPVTAIVAGSKVATKIGFLKELMERVNTIVIGGAMMHPFTKANGGKVGKSLCEPEDVEIAKDLIKLAKEKNVRLIYGKDCVVAKDFDLDTNTFAPGAVAKVVKSNKIPEGWQGLDIGPKTVNQIERAIGNSKTIIWNGPVGVIENETLAQGTTALAEVVERVAVNNQSKVIEGGGDLQKGLAKREPVKDADIFMSTGGGAMIDFIKEAGNLPGIATLAVK
jgi:phosphoglycerate kinase